MRHGRWMVALSALGMLGCTHFVQDTTQQVFLTSMPSKAQVYLNHTQYMGETPLALTLDPRQTYGVRLDHACYESRLIPLRPVMGIRQWGPLHIPVSQLDPTEHVELIPICPSLTKGGK